MSTLKQLQEKGEEEFDNLYSRVKDYDTKFRYEEILEFINEQTTLAYNAGKADMLDTVLKEIERFKTRFTKNNERDIGGWQDEIDTCNNIKKSLKNKLLDNKE